MPKMKTHSGSKKRFRVTKNGKIKRGAAFRRHHSWAKTTAGTMLESRGVKYVADADQKNIAKLLPYA